MDRINGADTVDIGSGRRGFRDENLVAGVAGTEVTAAFLNGLQEEVLNVVTQAGLVPSDGDWTQLWQALQILGLAADGRSRRWMSVLSMTLSSAPGAPSVGDAYLIPTGASGIWAANVGKIAEYTGASWVYLTPPNGHGISLPDGRVFIRIGGSYVELLASETRSGLVKLATVALAIAGVDTTSAVTPAGLASTLSNIVPPRPNLCPNGGFENGIGNIAVTKSGSGTWPSSITTNSWGRSIVLTGTKTDGTYVIAWPKFVADAGATYTISGDAALIAASGMVRYQIAWLDAADTVLSISTGPSRSAGDYSDSNARRQAMAGVVTAPAGAVSAQLQCVFDVAGATYIGARLAKVEKGGLPATAYTPPTPTIQHAMQVYNTAGTYTFVAPVTGWYWVKVYGGGGAAAAYTGNSQGEGGGGGGYSGKWVYHVAGDVTTVTVGAAGVYGGANGGTSSYGASHSATGGVTATAGGANGAGGTGIGGKINLTGQSGVDGNASGLWAGIGGDAAGPDGGKGAMSANGATWPGGGGGLLSYSSNIIWVGAPAAGGVIINY